jgi:hypothetical protein
VCTFSSHLVLADRVPLQPLPLSVRIEWHVAEKINSPLSDYKTDSVIQSSLRTELSKDTTVITIAHRLQTIMDADVIVRPKSPCIPTPDTKLTQMVLDAGRVVSTEPVNYFVCN